MVLLYKPFSCLLGESSKSMYQTDSQGRIWETCPLSKTSPSLWSFSNQVLHAYVRFSSPLINAKISSPLQGISFLDTVLEVSRNRQWLSKGMNDEMKEWLTMLLAPVDITSEKAESYLKDFLTTKMGGVTKLFSEHVKRDVSNLSSMHSFCKSSLLLTTFAPSKITIYE